MKARLEKSHLIIALSGILLLAGCLAAPGFEGPSMNNFDGTHFKNRTAIQRGPADMARLSFEALSEMSDWPEWVDTSMGSVPNSSKGIVVTFVNHATLLLQIGDVTVLTDPVYAERASPFSFAGPKRVHAPGIPLTELPDVDVILISHNHYDHLDLETLKAIRDQQVNRGSKPPLVLAGLGNGALLDSEGIENNIEMNWRDQQELFGLGFHFTECRHRSGRGIFDQNKTLWGSFVIESRLGNIYFAGDTGYDQQFNEAAEQFGEFALALLPIGAYEPRWFMAEIHLNPAEAVQAHLDLNARQSIGMHYGTFQLTFEAVDRPVKDLRVALKEAGLADEEFWAFEPGQSRRVK
ncbi:MAG: L-ascorbate metabolism protein UlaG (beta-lactamase superfamily) [Candidatus Azotimanducaceae bacterium]|jgi:L-ascorbate metabolism protein UlaG (beta-lactamase superfamily)